MRVYGIVFLALFSAKTAASDSWREAVPTVADSFIHVYSHSGKAGYPTNAEWMRFLLEAAHDPQTLQRLWPAHAFWGGIWASPALRPYKVLEGNVAAFISFKPGFYTVGLQEGNDHFCEWELEKKRQRPPNRFSAEQVALLQNAGLAWDSGFYDEFSLAGYAIGVSGFLIVNTDSIASLKIRECDPAGLFIGPTVFLPL